MKRRSYFTRHGFSLIEILVVMVLLVVAAAFILPHYLGGKTMDGKKVKSPIAAAHEVECSSDLNQVRHAISMGKMMNENEANPSDMASMKLPREITHCPIGGEEYVYNAQTGEVHCPHPGHERF
jgi:prepilin-type N-terminal cleavage/methylation domain-containing protein